jgi:hypothetical protein
MISWHDTLIPLRAMYGEQANVIVRGIYSYVANSVRLVSNKFSASCQ